jgi:hypothetical protein
MKILRLQPGLHLFDRSGNYLGKRQQESCLVLEVCSMGGVLLYTYGGGGAVVVVVCVSEGTELYRY